MNSIESVTPIFTPVSAEKIYHYAAFGLTFSSDIRFEEMTPIAPCDPDVTVRRAQIALPQTGTRRAIHFDFERDAYLLTWREFASFRIVGSDRIEVDPQPDIDETMLSFAFHGPVMAMLLHLRGKLVLHASCIAIDGRAVAFLGHKMAGKSTTAGAFVRAGHPMVSDDVVGLGLLADGGATVAPAFGQLKLAQDASEALALEAQVLKSGERALMSKQQHRMTNALVTSDVPMGSICILERGNEARLTPLDPIAALPEMLCHSYINRFGSDALSPRVKSEHMALLGKTLGQIPVYKFTVPDGLHRLDEAVELLETQMTGGAETHGSD